MSCVHNLQENWVNPIELFIGMCAWQTYHDVLMIKLNSRILFSFHDGINRFVIADITPFRFMRANNLI